jgi:hypothetical protein
MAPGPQLTSHIKGRKNVEGPHGTFNQDHSFRNPVHVSVPRQQQEQQRPKESSPSVWAGGKGGRGGASAREGDLASSSRSPPHLALGQQSPLMSGQQVRQ